MRCACAMPRAKKDQQKVPILKKTTVRCRSRSYYSIWAEHMADVAGGPISGKAKLLYGVCIRGEKIRAQCMSAQLACIWSTVYSPGRDLFAQRNNSCRWWFQYQIGWEFGTMHPTMHTNHVMSRQNHLKSLTVQTNWSPRLFWGWIGPIASRRKQTKNSCKRTSIVTVHFYCWLY